MKKCPACGSTRIKGNREEKFCPKCNYIFSKNRKAQIDYRLGEAFKSANSKSRNI